MADIGKLTIFVGPNAIGKTNIIEGIQLLTAQQSFRHPVAEQVINHGKNFARIDAEVSDGNRKLDLSLQVSEGKKKFYLNGKVKRNADLKGLIPSVLFTPDDLNLVKGSSSVKRAMIDNLGSQLSSNHYVLKKDYEKVIRYKNQLLKDEASDDFLASINETLITCGTQLCCYRLALFEKFKPLVKKYYETITEGRETFEMSYVPSWELYDQNNYCTVGFTRAEAREKIEQTLFQKVGEERARRRALVGPHADHFEFYINDKNALFFASQGQQRTIVLACKLAEVTLICDLLGQKPVLLLDDVMSELDESRRNALISFIKQDIQTFITTTNLNYFDDSLLTSGSIVTLPQ